MEWNFRTCLNTVHEAAKAMKDEGKQGGKIVLTSSVLALMSFAGYSTYSPSKYAIRGALAPSSCGVCEFRQQPPGAGIY